VSSDDVLLGLGLVLVLAVGAQLVARLTRLPAIVVLLPAGFAAGAATHVVQPGPLLGVVGALVAIPAAAAIQIAVREYMAFRRGLASPA